jgi:diguanylate cyclase (GGDEF)-like protein
MEVAEHLSHVPLFSELDTADIERLVEITRSVKFPAGANIVDHGEAGHSLFLILEGQVRVVYPSPSSEFELARLGPGDFFGEMALLNEKPRSATVQAIDGVSLLALSKTDFRDIVVGSPDVALRLLEALSVRVRAADEHIGTLSEKALKDALTGLLNRRSFEERLKEEIDRAIRYEERFAIIVCDIDRFKSVNDTFGHDVGDVVLSWVGRLLTEHTRAADTPFRIGGEEFAVLAPATPAEPAHMVAQRLIEVIAEARPPVDFEMQVTMSAGYASCPGHGASPEQLFRIADSALLKAKEDGRNRVGRPEVETDRPA